MNLHFDLVDAFRHLLALGREPLQIQPNAVELHFGEHADKRDLNLAVELVETFLFQPALEQFGQAPSHLSIFTCVLGDLGDGHLIHALLILAALANQVRDRNGLVRQIAHGEIVEIVAQTARIEQVVGHHGIARDAADGNSLAFKHQHVILDVLVDLADVGIAEDRAQRTENEALIQALVGLGRTDRDVPGLAWPPGECQSDDVDAQRIEAGGFEVECEA